MHRFAGLVSLRFATLACALGLAGGLADIPTGHAQIPVADLLHADSLPSLLQPEGLVASITVSPPAISRIQAPDSITQHTLAITSTGTAPLDWNITETAFASRYELSDSRSAIASPQGVGGTPEVSLILDQGLAEVAIGLTNGGQFLWLNRFSPDPASFPITLDRIDVMFGEANGFSGVNVGELVDIYLYEDPDGNPANGATHRGSLLGQAVQWTNGSIWSTYSLEAPVQFDTPGDILVGVVNRTAGIKPGTRPASIEQTPPRLGRSWIGIADPWGDPPADPPELPMPTFALMDTFSNSGNWLIRAFGGGRPCFYPEEVPWLSVSPTAGTTAAGEASEVTVTLDSSGLLEGDYSALLCVNSNDQANPLIVVPVTLSVKNNRSSLCRTPNVPLVDAIDFFTPGVLTDTRSVTEARTIADLDVYILANHSFVGDMQFELEHVPSGLGANLIDRPGYPAFKFGCTRSNIAVRVDDEGPDTPIELQCNTPAPAIAGRAPGSDPPSTTLLAAFDGLDAQGDWVLTATDYFAGDSGTLFEWCLDFSFVPPPEPSIDLEVTVGTQEGVCADTSAIAVPSGTEVTYCYHVTNTGNVAHTLHDLEDDALGVILSGLDLVLSPGGSTFVLETATVTENVTNTATWDAYSLTPAYIASDESSATVVVVSNLTFADGFEQP